jgi:hypothetical protein
VRGADRERGGGLRTQIPIRGGGWYFFIIHGACRGQGEGGRQGTGRRPTYHTKDAMRAAIWSQKEGRACVVV